MNFSSTYSKDLRLFPWAGCGVSGEGAWLLTERARVLDTVCALGAVILGYGHNSVVAAVSRAASGGGTYSISSELEQRVGRRLCALFQIDHLRFTRTGSDACRAAVMLARAVHPKRPRIAVERNAYHGWHVQWKPPHHGMCTEEIKGFELFDWRSFPDGLEEVLEAGDVGAVLIEPPVEEPAEGWLPTLRALCDKYEALLIMDETVTMLRHPHLAAYLSSGVRPDLVVGGKALANGHGLYFIGGRGDIIEMLYATSPVFVSTTHGADECALAACEATLDVYLPEGWRRLEENGRAIWDAAQGLDMIHLVGSPYRWLAKYPNREIQISFEVAMWQSGVLWKRPVYTNLAWGEDELRHLRHALRAVEGRLRKGWRWKGEMPRTLFSNR